MHERNDGGLEGELLRQHRPERPAGLEEAREQMEALMVPGLIQRGLSAPEARVEAMNTLARFERLAVGRALEKLVEAAPGEGGAA